MRYTSKKNIIKRGLLIGKKISSKLSKFIRELEEALCKRILTL